MTAAEQHRYEPGHPIARFCCGELMKLIKTIRIGSSGAADLSLRTMPQRRNDRGEVKTKESMKRRVPSWLINLAKPTPAPWTSISAIKQVTRDMARNRLKDLRRRVYQVLERGSRW